MLLQENSRLQENLYMNEFMTNQDKKYPSEQAKVNLTLLSIPVQKLRDCVGELRITSGWRSVEFNKKVNGSSNSFHLQGIACDLEFIKRVNGVATEDYGDWTVDTLLPLLNLIGFNNVGFYVKNGKFAWIHLDTGKTWGTVKDWKAYSPTLSYRIVNV